MRKWLILSAISALITLLCYYIITKSEINIILNSSVQTFNIMRNSSVFIGVGLTGLFAISSAVSALKKAKQSNAIETQQRAAIEERSTDPVKQIVFEIEEYYKTDETIDKIKDGLTTIAKSLTSVKCQYDNISLLVGNRFDKNSISHIKFIAPAQNLFQTMIKAVSDLIQRLKLFDEAECNRKIEKYKTSGDFERANQQADILANYLNYISEIIKSIDEISLRFDRLILEIGKLSDEELKKSLAMLTELDNVIANTKLYQD